MHPLRVPVSDAPASTIGVLVHENPIDDVRDGFEPTVGVPRRPFWLTGAVIDLAHLVHMHKRVQL